MTKLEARKNKNQRAKYSDYKAVQIKKHMAENDHKAEVTKYILYGHDKSGQGLHISGQGVCHQLSTSRN